MEPEASMEGLCPICLDLLHRPHSLQPCQHLFCDPCLRRLAENSLLLPSEYNGNCLQKCPVCRSPIEDCHLDQELHDSIEDQHQDLYIQRQQVEMNSGIFNLPLPPVRRRTLAELINEWSEWSPVVQLVMVMVILLILPVVVVVAVVVTIAEQLFLRLMAMINQLIVEVPDQDQPQQL